MLALFSLSSPPLSFQTCQLTDKYCFLDSWQYPIAFSGKCKNHIKLPSFLGRFIIRPDHLRLVVLMCSEALQKYWTYTMARYSQLHKVCQTKKDHVSTSHCFPKLLLYDSPGWQTLPDGLPEERDNLDRDESLSSGSASTQSSAGFYVSAGIAGISYLQNLPHDLQASCICIWMLPPCFVLVSSYSWIPEFFYGLLSSLLYFTVYQGWGPFLLY